jgi:type IV pilus assembly protein PilY1
MNDRPSTLRRFIVYATLACVVSEPAFAATTDISNVPLSSGSSSPTPNLMFILDDSGSMGRDFLPDYVAAIAFTGQTESRALMPRSDGTQDCEPGDPCYYAGGANGFNGVAYDPSVNYRAGVKYDGTTYLAAPLSTTALTPDAYLGGTNVNLTNSTVARDKVWCNQASGGVCKRNGADNSGNVLASGGLDFDSKSDGTSFTMAAGQFPYRSHKSNSSTERFGLPETMPAVASWSRSGTTVTFTTATPHGLAAGNTIVVRQTGNANIDGNARAVSASGLTAVQFQFTATSGGGTAGTVGFYRRHDSGSWTRASSTVTVTTSAAHGLQVGDLIHAQPSSSFTAGAFTVTAVPTATTFQYTSSTGTGTIAGTWVRTGLYNVLQSSPASNPITYRITPVEYCSDAALTTCTVAATPGTVPPGFGFPAYLRFCKTLADATAPGAVSGTSGSPATARCVSKFIETDTPTYHYARYGLFTRESIVSTTASCGDRPARNDCAGAPSCTYAEEIQNYARWYTYYRTRLNTMKTAGGRALQSFVHNPTASPTQHTKLRVGFITINAQKDGSGNLQSAVQPVRYLKVADFAGGAAGTHADTWFSKLYTVGKSASPRVDIINVLGATPLREALSRVGWIFSGKMGAGLTGGLTQANDDPVQMSCQRNFALLTSDGYWNGPGGQMLNGTAMDNQDNVNPTPLAGYTDAVVNRSTGTYDGNLLPGTTAGASAGGAGTLADIAMYYYKNDLRGGTAPHTGPAVNGAGNDVSANNVPSKAGNKNFVNHQHMVTYSVGMVDGLMRYQTDYETSLTGDFANIRNGAAGQCLWTTGTCDWPSPRQDQASALDDLWHAAVNGRGTYYSGRDAASLASGLESALSALNLQVAAAAASSTSSPNITQTDRQIFSTTYETETWSGRIVSQNIDPITGSVDPTILWQADTQLLTKVAASADARTIKTFNAAAADKLKNFAWVSLNATERAYFAGKCSSNPTNMSQCTSITGGATQADVNDGSKLVGYLRGWTGLELNADFSVGSFRDRKFIEPGGAVTQTILGDTINAKPAYVRAPLLSYGDTGYAAFKSANQSRAPRLFVGANDGYLHAFDGNTGNEAWAYLPRFLMPGLWVLADAGYKTRHTYFADGSPETADVYDSASSTWKTILVAGVNSGGRGYYALDITDPNTPKGLWEFCSDSTSCGVNSANLGLTYGNPVIGKRSSDGKWVVVVTSGLNNVVTGDGKGYFYVLDAITGAILDTVPTNVGDVVTPSGLSKIAGFFDNAVTDATFRYVYGGDQLGNVWRLDLGTAAAPSATVTHVATLKDSSGKAQPITTKPSLTTIGTNKVVYIGTGRYMGNTDLSDPATHVPPDTTTAWQQSLYAFKDKGTDYGNNIRTGATLVTQTLTSLGANSRTVSDNPVNWNASGDDGWVIDFNPGNATPGERVNIDPELVLGTLIVTTNVPVAATGGASCSIGGDSWQYQFDFRTGSFLSTATGQVAGTRTGSVVTVGVAVIQLPSGAIKTIITGADTSKTTGTVNIGAGAGTVRRFSYRER